MRQGSTRAGAGGEPVESTSTAPELAGLSLDEAAQKAVSAILARAERAHEARKMDAIAQLTGGIAHHFNNMLTGIMPSVEIAMRDASPRSLALLENAREATERAALMVRQLLLFAGGDLSSDAVPQCAMSVVQRALLRFGEAHADDITCDFDWAPGLPQVSLDAAQFEQALLHVLRNAREACENVEGRRAWIRVSAYALAREAAAAQASLDLTASQYVAVRIEDNGVGMSEAVLRRAFEPFFTTKDIGRGTGLGLAMVYGIMRQHRGSVTCHSRHGEGSIFTLLLPAHS